MYFEQFLPTRIQFGSGSLKTVGSYARKFGNKALLVRGRSAEQTGALGQLIDSLKVEGVDYTVSNTINSDPTNVDVDALVSSIRQENCNLIIALGGGSVIDAGKAAAVSGFSESCNQLIGQTLTSNENSLPTIAVPTTAGTGAEVTKGAIITDLSRRFKSGIRGEDIFPKVAIVDPNLLETMPQRVMEETIFDSFTHATETFVARKANPISEALSKEALTILSKLLVDGKIDISHPQTREKLSMAALLGGINIGMVSSCLPHRLQQAMGGVESVSCSHGRGLALVYPAWLKYAYPYARGKFDFIVRTFKATSITEAIELIFQRLNMTEGMADFGYERKDITTFLKAVSGNVENDPIPRIGESLISSIFEASF